MSPAAPNPGISWRCQISLKQCWVVRALVLTGQRGVAGSAICRCLARGSAETGVWGREERKLGFVVCYKYPLGPSANPTLAPGCLEDFEGRALMDFSFPLLWEWRLMRRKMVEPHLVLGREAKGTASRVFSNSYIWGKRRVSQQKYKRSPTMKDLESSWLLSPAV